MSCPVLFPSLLLFSSDYYVSIFFDLLSSCSACFIILSGPSKILPRQNNQLLQVFEIFVIPGRSHPTPIRIFSVLCFKIVFALSAPDS